MKKRIFAFVDGEGKHTVQMRDPLTKKKLFQVSGQSFGRLMENLELLKEFQQIPLTGEEKLSFSNGMGINKEGKLERFDSLGMYPFVEIKTFFSHIYDKVEAE